LLQPYYHHPPSVHYRCVPCESLGHLSIMSQTLRKRGREPEALMDAVDVQEPKRFHGEETDRFLHLLQLEKTLADDEEEEECFHSEELVERVMRSLEEEIGVTISTRYPSSSSRNNSVAFNVSSGQEGQTLDLDSVFDPCYLVEAASDDKLAIQPSPVLDLKYEVCLSPKETSESLPESGDLKSLAENWHFGDDFENYQQFGLYEDSWDVSQLRDYMNRDFVSLGLVFDGEIC